MTPTRKIFILKVTRKTSEDDPLLIKKLIQERDGDDRSFNISREVGCGGGLEPASASPLEFSA